MAKKTAKAKKTIESITHADKRAIGLERQRRARFKSA